MDDNKVLNLWTQHNNVLNLRARGHTPSSTVGLVSAQSAQAAIEASGLEHVRTEHGRVSSLEEAAAARGVQPADIIKTMVVRRGEGDYLFVLVPGDREISWPKLRALLGVNRLSMPDAATAQQVTGYARGTITPFGSTTAWPVIADASLTGDPQRHISIGGGGHGIAYTMGAVAMVQHLQALVADVTELS